MKPTNKSYVLKFKDIVKLKVIGWKYICHLNINQIKSRIAITMLSSVHAIPFNDKRFSLPERCKNIKFTGT